MNSFLIFLIFLSTCRFGDFSLSKLLIFWVYAGFVHFWHQNVVFFEYMQVLGLFRIKMFVFFEYMQVWGTSGSQNLHILKKIKVLIVKSHQTYIYSKKIKTSQTLCCIDELVFDFLDSFEYMQVLCALLALKCWSFLSICRFWAVPYQNDYFFVYMQVWGTWGSPNLHILKKDQHFDAKSAQNLHILKKSKVLIVKSHQTCMYSQKSKTTKISDSMWDWLT